MTSKLCYNFYPALFSTFSSPKFWFIKIFLSKIVVKLTKFLEKRCKDDG